MKNKLSLSLITLFSLTACSSPDIVTDMSAIQNQTDVNASDVKAKNSTVDNGYLQQVVSSLDLNKDGKIEATEVPILVGGKNVDYVENSDGSAISGYLPVAGKEMSVSTVMDMMNKGASLSIMTSKVSEKNKDKIISNFASAVLKDPLAEKGRVFGYSTTVGYFTGKTTVVVRSMDSSILTREIKEQLTIGNGTVNGVPYQSGNGSVSVLPNVATIDGKYKARLRFGYYDYFESGIQLIGYHKIKDASSKIVSE
jgi:hypothetical protein